MIKDIKIKYAIIPAMFDEEQACELLTNRLLCGKELSTKIKKRMNDYSGDLNTEIYESIEIINNKYNDLYLCTDYNHSDELVIIEVQKEV